MPEYKCDCCNYSTHIKTQYDRHINSVRHNKKITDFETNEDKTEIQELREIVENHEQTITNMAAEIAALKSSLQECKELIWSNIKNPPTYNPTPPPEPKKETCNPMYIAKKLDEDPDNKDILPIDDFFKIANEEVDFDFDDINDMKDVGKKYAIDKIMDFVKNNKKIVPFRYQKSSWYIKGNNGWEKEIIQSNKNCKTGTSQYTFSIIVEKFIFIFANRINRYFQDKYGDNYPYVCDGEYARISSEVLSKEGYRNSDILKSIGHFC